MAFVKDAMDALSPLPVQNKVSLGNIMTPRDILITWNNH